jgi:hypothetical protein
MKVLVGFGVFSLIILSIILMSCNTEQKALNPGQIWKDNNGVHINAHGGGILIYEGDYYWFGEHKIEGKAGNKAHVGVHCYSSKNLTNWKDEGIALAVHKDTTSLLVKGCIVERPKVIYNEKTNKFVMWFHHEVKGMGYKAVPGGNRIRHAQQLQIIRLGRGKNLEIRAVELMKK